MKVEYQLTQEDLAAFAEHHHLTSPAAKRQRLGCFAFGLIALSLLPALCLVTTDKPLWETAKDIWPLLAGPVAFSIVALPYMRWRTRVVFKRLLSEGKNQHFYGDCELELGSETLVETRESGTTSRSWTSVARMVATPHHLFVYTSGVEAFVIPRRAFSTDAELDHFAKALAERSGVEWEGTIS